MRAPLLLGLVVIALALGWLFRSRRDALPSLEADKPETTSPLSAGVVTSVTRTTSEKDAPPFAERILEQYADPARPPEEDLHDLARMLGNFTLLVKGDNPVPLGANEEIAAALRGKNKAALRALPDVHRAFNAQGQLVDRWSTPLYFHAESRDRLDVRSAGPDRRMWTKDDLHRQHDGRFLRGEALVAPSLFQQSPR
jgi:hypothetical protein